MLALVLLISGCWGGKKTNTPEKPPDKGSVVLPPRFGSTGSETAGVGSLTRPVEAAVVPDKARQRELELESNLETTSKMIRSANLDAALRRIEKMEQENPGNAHLLMKTGYLKAMVFHRQKEPARRREAMNQMLKNMETMQKDPMFRAAFADGQDGAEVIRKSLERGGGRYGQ